MPLDPRDVTVQQQGTPLRDGAVNPAESDYLGPTNAGVPGEMGNPHGPTVVNPGLHTDESVRSIPRTPDEAAQYANLSEWQPQTEAAEVPDPEA